MTVHVARLFVGQEENQQKVNYDQRKPNHQTIRKTPGEPLHGCSLSPSLSLLYSQGRRELCGFAGSAHQASLSGSSVMNTKFTVLRTPSAVATAVINKLFPFALFSSLLRLLIFHFAVGLKYGLPESVSWF